MKDNVTPIFLLSLPRSGSTLAQRVIAAHPQVATTAEPWIMLPLYAAFEQNMCKARYGQKLLTEAVADLCEKLPHGRGDYHVAARAFASSIYGAIAAEKGARFFLDKTPRYHLIVHHLLEAFPDAKFVILWRNPLATLGSHIHSYGEVWRVQLYDVDLYDGLANLVRVYEAHPDRFCTIRYEDMVSCPETVFKPVFEHIGLDFDREFVSSFTGVSVNGRMGDKSGLQEYSAITQKPLEKWRKTLASPVRRAWCRQYLRWLGEERLRIMGYESAEILEQLEAIPNNWRTVPSDLARFAHSRWALYQGGML